MKPLLRQLAIAAGCLACAGAAAAAVTVRFDHPERFAELPFASLDRQQVLTELSAHFNKLGKALPPGQDLKVEVIDLGLAGRARASRRTGQEIRVLTGGADWPRIRLRYALAQGDKLIASGDADLSDMAYLEHVNRYPEGDSLRYEKQMLDDWFRKTFGAGQGRK